MIKCQLLYVYAWKFKMTRCPLRQPIYFKVGTLGTLQKNEPRGAHHDAFFNLNLISIALDDLGSGVCKKVKFFTHADYCTKIRANLFNAFTFYTFFLFFFLKWVHQNNMWCGISQWYRKHFFANFETIIIVIWHLLWDSHFT